MYSDMAGNARGISRYQSLRDSRVVLARMAPLVRLGLFGLGVSLFLDQVRPMISDAQFTWGERRVMGLVALITLGGFGLAGWVAGRLVRALADLIEVFADGAEAAWRASELVELHLVPTLSRISERLDRVQPADHDQEKARLISAVRRALADGQFGQAERLVQAIVRDYPGSSEASMLVGELAEARQAIVDDLRAQLDAARVAGDPEGVIEARDVLTQHLRGDPLKDLDRRVVRWLVGLIQKRVRAGTSPVEVAELASRVADSFGDTPEGASLLASLPSLRRDAGLCPRCGRPYAGPADACPRCLSNGARSTPDPSRGVPNPKELL